MAGSFSMGLQQSTLNGCTFNSVRDQTNNIYIYLLRPGDFASPQLEICMEASPRARMSPSPMFTGRQDILDKMFSHFDPTLTSVNLGSRRDFVLYGMGGAGKTETTLMFVNKCFTQFSHVFFINASTVDSIERSFQLLVRNLPQGQSPSNAALSWLSSSMQEWLLVLDNADDPQLKLLEWLPPCNHGNVIITTRNPACSVYAPGSNINVSGMDPPDAVQLLLKSAMLTSSDSIETAVEIARELSYFALTIVQAGSYIHQSCQRLDKYLQIYKENKSDLLMNREIQHLSLYNYAVYTTWEVSWKKLSPVAQDLLSLCAFLHFDGISLEIFRKAAKSIHTCYSDSAKCALDFLSQLCTPQKSVEYVIRQALNELNSFSLITVNWSNEIFSIHPLVHSWARDRLLEEERERRRNLTICLLVLAINKDNTVENLNFRRSILPHTTRLGEHTVNTDMRDRDRLALVFDDWGMWKESQKIRIQVTEWMKHNLGNHHEDTLMSMANLADTHRAQGQLKEAEELELKAIDLIKKNLGEEYPDVWYILQGNLANTYWNQGRWKEAEEIDVQVLDLRKRTCGEKHPQTLTSMANLAATYREQKRWEEAEDLQMHVLDLSRQVLGNEHPDTLSSMSHLAITYLRWGRLKQFEELQVRVLGLCREHLGEAHPVTLTRMRRLAAAYRDQGRLEEADELDSLAPH